MLKVRVHPRFKHKHLFDILSYWPLKGELYICHAKDLNVFNQATNIVLVDQLDYREYLDPSGLCCYSIEDLVLLVEEKGRALLKGPPIKPTYTTIGDSGTRNYSFHMLLKDWSFVNILGKNGDKVKEVTYLLVLAVNPRVAHLSWDIKCFLKNKVKGEGIEVLGKAELPVLIPQYFTKTQLFNGTYPEEGGIWIVKPTTRASSGGKGIGILTCKEDLTHVLNELKGDPAIIQEYITDPLLFKGKKFHFRIWVMITTWGQHYIMPSWRIVTAKLPYIKSDWNNKEIHDTHLKSTDDNYYHNELANELPEDSEAQVNGMVMDMIKHCKIEPHEGVRFAYHVLGLDVMVAQNKFYLLEANRSPSRVLTPFNPDIASKEWEWEWGCIQFLFKK